MISKLVIFSIMSLISSIAYGMAVAPEFKNYISKPYADIRNNLISNGWSPLVKKNNDDKSFYAQEVSSKGYPEVINCISMERDQCEFAFIKKQKIIFIKTKDKNLIIESITLK